MDRVVSAQVSFEVSTGYAPVRGPSGLEEGEIAGVVCNSEHIKNTFFLYLKM